ncbi:MAG: endonuclease domain-containing protein [bacterium]
MVYVQRTREFLLHLSAKKSIFSRAPELRKKMTPAERLLWREIRNRKLMGFKFRRQHPIHIYIADFYCHEIKLVIEIDGGIHNSDPIKENYQNRTAELDRLGISVIRFTNDQINKNTDQVLTDLKQFILSLPLNSPSP